jgi:hypothetical protein
MDPIFDPFNDRMARDIRNSLSSALISDLCSETVAGIDRVTRAWMRQELRSPYRAYIRQTLHRYHRVVEYLRSKHVQDPEHQALVLWNAGLFFELHELLETVWRGASGEARAGLKGLIQAAGVYVHQLRGNAAAARGLALRARQNLLAGRDHLAFIGDLDRLIQGLEDPSRPPPTLQMANERDDLH